jgi:hypothetical protein
MSIETGLEKGHRIRGIENNAKKVIETKPNSLNLLPMTFFPI